MAQDKDIPNISATTVLIERFETVDDLANADREGLTAFFAETGRGRFVDPESTATYELRPEGLTVCSRQ